MFQQLPPRTPRATSERDGLMSKEDKARLDKMETQNLKPDGVTIIENEGELALNAPYVAKWTEDAEGRTVKLWNNGFFEFFQTKASTEESCDFDLSSVGNIARYGTIQATGFGSNGAEYLNAPIVSNAPLGESVIVTCRTANKSNLYGYSLYACGYLNEGESNE